MQYTDLDFEEKYLNRGDSKGYWYKNRVILTKNLFGLCPGITAGNGIACIEKIKKRKSRDTIFKERNAFI